MVAKDEARSCKTKRPVVAKLSKFWRCSNNTKKLMVTKNIDGSSKNQNA